jgi:hypothetical protein
VHDAGDADCYDVALRAPLEAALAAGIEARDFLKCASLQKRLDALDVAKVRKHVENEEENPDALG